MYVKLGNADPIQPYREDVDPDDHTRDQLVGMCEAAGLPTDGTKDVLAARLSAVTRTKAMTIPDGEDWLETEMQFPDDMSRTEAFVTITERTWPQWSNGTPVWVSSDDGVLARLLGDHYDCEVR